MCVCVCFERIPNILSPWNHFSVVFVSILCVVCRLIVIVFKSSFVLVLFYPHPLYYAYLYNATMMMVTLEWQYVNAGVVGVANKVIKAIFYFLCRNLQRKQILVCYHVSFVLISACGSCYQFVESLYYN